MRILLLTHGFNSLCQRLFVELEEQGHELAVEFDIHDAVTTDAVERWKPDLIVAPYLKRAIPEAVWREYVCLVVHPGIEGDRGPSALDWAILNGEQTWGVTILQATGELDAGPVWATTHFPMRPATKSSLYRNEVTEAAVGAVLAAVERFAREGAHAPSVSPGGSRTGRWRPPMRRTDRAIDWRRDDTETVLRKIRSADGSPGVGDGFLGRELFLYDAHPDRRRSGGAGALIARCGPAVCRATVDGAVWIGHVRDKHGPHPFKLPATRVLAAEIEGLTEITPEDADAYRDIWYEESGRVGYLHFTFYNGAMGVEQCHRLLEAYRRARDRDTRLIVLMGGPDFWSNGMHLNLIEAADSAADESWRNIVAIDDVAREIITTQSHLTVSALRGNAGAGGVMLARAADRVWARIGIVLNPHYKDMGNLYGSEYWTYLLPRHAGPEHAQRLTQARLPMGTREAVALGLVDERFGADAEDFVREVQARAQVLADDPALDRLLAEKNDRRARDEALKPLADYRAEELDKMKLNFYGFDPSYHVARYNFVHKVAKSRTPLTIARHRRPVASAVRPASR